MTEKKFIEVPEIFDFDYNPEGGALIPESGYVLYDGEAINLCPMCVNSPISCDNYAMRLVQSTDQTTGEKILADGLSNGQLTESEVLNRKAFVCAWFEQK